MKFPSYPKFKAAFTARPREGNLRSFFDATDLNKAETKRVQREELYRWESVKCGAGFLYVINMLLVSAMLQLEVEHRCD